MTTYDSLAAFNGAVTANFSISTAGSFTGITGTIKSESPLAGFGEPVELSGQKTVGPAGETIDILSPSDGHQTGSGNLVIEFASDVTAFAADFLGATAMEIELYDANNVCFDRFRARFSTLSQNFFLGVASEKAFRKIRFIPSGASWWGMSGVVGVAV